MKSRFLLRTFQVVGLAFIASLLSLHAIDASAQVGFSRACAFTELGTTNRELYYSVTKQTINGVPIHQQPAEIEIGLFALESITADYASFRYWLLAYSGHYKYNTLFRSYNSTWNSRSLYDNNRGPATSVRAGHDFNIPSFDGPGPFQLIAYASYGVTGVHYYYRPEVGRFFFIGITKATDCNCPEFGFQFTWANQFANFICTRF